MAKKSPIPGDDAGRVTWFQNWATKLVIHGPNHGISATEITGTTADNAMLHHVWDYLVAARQRMQDLTGHKQILFDGPAFPPLPALPPPVTVGPPPAFVAADIFGRALSIAARIRRHPIYSHPTGVDLGIEGAQIVLDVQSLKPVIAHRLVAGGHCEIVWVKGHATSLELQVNRGQGWEFLAVDTQPNYIDTCPLPAPGQAAVWQYRAIYRIGDERVGQWSDPLTVTVLG